MMIKITLLILGLFTSTLYSQCDTVTFSSEKVGLIILTHNLDTIKIQEGKKHFNPFSPSMSDYSARVFAYENSSLTIKVQDTYREDLIVFIWKKISHGAYIFDWWEYIYITYLGVHILLK